jgi:hypothetical protein
MGMTYQRGAVWWVKYYRNGRPMRESSGSTKESDAIQLLKIREGDITARIAGESEAQSDPIRRSRGRSQD